MSYTPSFVSGDWKATCQICGRVFKGSMIRRRWDGFYVCVEDWEPKHPQLSVKGVRDDQRAPFVLPDTHQDTSVMSVAYAEHYAIEDAAYTVDPYWNELGARFPFSDSFYTLGKP